MCGERTIYSKFEKKSKAGNKVSGSSLKKCLRTKSRSRSFSSSCLVCYSFTSVPLSCTNPKSVYILNNQKSSDFCRKYSASTTLLRREFQRFTILWIKKIFFLISVLSGWLVTLASIHFCWGNIILWSSEEVCVSLKSPLTLLSLKI